MTPIMRQIITGKKKTKYYTLGVEDVAWVEGYKAGNIKTYTEKSTNIVIHTERTTASTQESAVTDVTVDLTRIKTLYIDWENTGSANVNNQSIMTASTTKLESGATYAAMLLIESAFARKVDTLDVSNLIGSYYIAVRSKLAYNGLTGNIVIYNVWGKS